VYHRSGTMVGRIRAIASQLPMDAVLWRMRRKARRMLVIVDVSVEGDERPAAGAPIHVEVRDTSLADAPAQTVGAADDVVRGESGRWLDTVELNVPRLPAHSTVWAHVDVDRDGRVSRGDFITTAAYPVSPGDEVRVAVTVRKV
jgi:hypothetical protein